MIRLGIMAILAVTAHCFLSPRKLNGKRELVKVNFLNDHRQGNRFARSTGEGETFQFPEVLIFNVTVDGDAVTLTLHRSSVNRANPPVFVYEDGKLVRREPRDSLRRALYQSVNSRASYLVTCTGPEPEQCSMHGSFYRGEQRYQMSPRTNFNTDGMHELIRVEGVANDDVFNGDALVPPSDEVPSGTRNDDSPGPNRRIRRALPDANIVEFLAMPDESVYEAFLVMEKTDEAAEDAMGLYYALITNEIDLHYLSVPMVYPSLSFNIRVGFAGVVIAKNGSEAGWSRDNTVERNGKTYLNAGGPNGALRAFSYWRNARRSNYTKHDHAMAFTMKDFAYVTDSSISSGLLGQAWLGQVCKYWDTSVTEDGGVRVALIAAHELGHSLNSSHDGNGNTCNNTIRNVMSSGLVLFLGAEAAANQWTFSSCSVDQFNTYISSLGNNHCMTRHDSIADDSLDDPILLPGQYYSLDQQCKFRAGPSATACSSSPVPESACHSGIRCNPSCSSSLYVLAGTPCGSANETKWCYKGICTNITTEEPTTTTTTEEPTTTTTTTTVEPTTTTTTTTEEPTTTTTTTTEEPTTTTTTEEPTTTTTTTTEEPTTTTTTEKPTTTTTTEEPTTTTTTEEPTTTTTTTTEEPTTTTTTEKPTTTTTTEEPTTTTTTEEPTTTTTTTTTTTEEPTTTTTTEEPTTTTTTTTEEPTTTTTTEKPTTTTTTEEPTTTTTTEEPTTTSTTEEPTTTTTTEEPTTTTTTEEPTTTKKPINYCKKWCYKKKSIKGKKRRCRGKNCCRWWWGKWSLCCTECKK